MNDELKFYDFTADELGMVKATGITFVKYYITDWYLTNVAKF